MESLSNFDTEEISNKANNSDLVQNFVGAFQSDKMNKFLDFKKMMKGKKYQFLIANTDRPENKVLTGGAFWICIEKKIFCCLILLELRA